MSENSGSRKRPTERQLRERKQKKLYSEDWALGDDDIEGRRKFNLEEKLVDPAFPTTGVVREMKGADLNVAHFQRYGFNTPLLFKDKTGLGLRVPTSNFTVNDVRTCVGSRRVLDVMDVNTQKNQEMTMKEWQKYYDDPDKNRLLNVISLEFSHTKLENYIQSPTVVRQLDWVDNVWPRHLKNQQTESTNLLEDMKYPKVQKYCLMSVKGCYTDFHVDFGGTSVWYHILRGSKIFWLIPPTEHNLQLYEKWVLSGKQSDIFFGDKVDRCARIKLKSGDTFFIPTGWIHAVYTPTDSLVFGGNFLHSYGIEKQLKIAQVEDNTKVPQKFRYPFFTEMLWYVLERYVHCLMGRSHLSTGSDVTVSEERPIHMTHMELHGLKEIVLYLHMLPANRKNVPELIKDPVALIQDVRTLISLHRLDRPEIAISGRAILWVQISGASGSTSPSTSNMTDEIRQKKNNGNSSMKEKCGMNHFGNAHQSSSSKVGGAKVMGGAKSSVIAGNGEKTIGSGCGPRRRRTRCKKCEACRRNDCGECSFCLDMVKFGGPGRAKQTCNMRQCLQPMLPVTAACLRCGLDGWNQTPLLNPLQKIQQQQQKDKEQRERCETASNLMECSVCYEITHPACSQRECPDYTGYVNEDMPNSWECPQCCKTGKNADYRPRHFRARQKSTDFTSSISQRQRCNVTKNITDDHASPPTPSSAAILPIKKRRNSQNIEETGIVKQHTILKNLTSCSSRQLKRATHVVRPFNVCVNSAGEQQIVPTNNLALDKRCVLKVFEFLRPHELYACSLVCKTWASYVVDPSLWKKMEFTRRRISSDILKGIVRRQPTTLHLDWCQINKHQLPWLVQRLPHLRRLSLVGVDVKTAASLRCCPASTPQLRELDLSFVADFNDSALRDVLAPPDDNRRGVASGLGGRRFRFKELRVLRLAGTDITDVAMRYVTQYVPALRELSLAFCPRITDAGIAQLSTKPAATVTNLVTLDLSHAKLITETSLDHLQRCENLTRLDCRHSMGVSTQSLIRFAANGDRDLHVRDVKLVEKRPISRRI